MKTLKEANSPLTIFTDCSHHRKVGAWSVLLKSESDSMIISGICPKYIVTAAQGEAYAIFKAIGLAQKLFPNKKNLHINTDCVGLCFVLSKNARPQKHHVNRMLQKIIVKTLLDKGYTWKISHVKSHQQNNFEHTSLNNLVDSHARSIRRRNQEQILTNQKPDSLRRVAEFMSRSGFFSSSVFNLFELIFKPEVSPEMSSVKVAA